MNGRPPLGGRVFGRGLRLALIAVCAAGIGLTAKGAYIPAKAVLAQVLLERAFDRSVATHHPHKPWPWADMAPAARISVPRLGVERIVLDTGSGQAMAFGPTLLPGGARVGQMGTAVISAHRDTHFSFLREVRRGDVIIVETLDGTRWRYVATGSEVVRWDRFTVGANGRSLALTTCYPFNATHRGPLRYVLRGKLA